MKMAIYNKLLSAARPFAFLVLGFSALPNLVFAKPCPSNFKTDGDMLQFIESNMTEKDRAFDAIRIETIDFNSNGKSDRLISTGCGTGGCQYDIFLRTEDDTFQYAGHAFFFSDYYKVLKNSDPSVLDVLAYNHSSATEGELVRYKISCSETKTVAATLGTAEDLLPFVTDNKFAFKGIGPMDPINKDQP